MQDWLLSHSLIKEKSDANKTKKHGQQFCQKGIMLSSLKEKHLLKVDMYPHLLQIVMKWEGGWHGRVQSCTEPVGNLRSYHWK